MNRRVYRCRGRLRGRSLGAGAKASLKRATSGIDTTRNRVSYPWPEWSGSKDPWRLEPTSIAKGGEELWIGVKCQSNAEIAGSPRNAFGCSLRVNCSGCRALNGLGGRVYLPNSIKLQSSERGYRRVRQWGLSFIVERETAQIAS